MNITHSLQFILPELVLLAFALAAMIWGALSYSKNIVGVFALIGVMLSAFFLPASFQAGSSAFSNMLVNDAFSVFFRAVFLFVAGIVILLSMGYRELEAEKGEYYFFLLIVTISMMLAVASNHLMMIYIAVETISIVSYILVGYSRRDVLSSESGVKYFLFGALSTGIMLYGISLVYGMYGTLDLGLIAIHQNLPKVSLESFAFWLALGLILVGLGFKASVVPFHMWTPDVYQGAPTPIAGFLSVGPKAVGFALLLRIFIQNFHLGNWNIVAIVIAALTMTVGNVMAMGQQSVKRLLAYSSIAQAGYIFVGLAAASTAGVQAVLFYIVTYALMNLGAFGCVIAISNSIKSDSIDGYAGFYKRDPFTAVVLTISLLSLAGIPPLAGFLAKFFLLAAAVEAKLTALAVVAALNSVIALYYYLKIVKLMFFRESQETALVPQSFAIQSALLITVVGNVVLGIWPHWIMDWLAVFHN